MPSTNTIHRALLRLYVAAVLFSTWMILLFTGFALNGGAHLLLVLALAFFPWRAAAGTDPSEAEDRR